MKPAATHSKKKRSLLWPLLLAGGLLFLALVILFGATKAYFSSARLKGELAKALADKTAEIQVDVQDMELTLTGFLPRLAVEARQVRLQWLKDCRVPPVIFDRATVRFSWRALFKGQFRLGPVSIHHLQADFNDSRCAGQESPATPAEYPAPAQQREVQSQPAQTGKTAKAEKAGEKPAAPPTKAVTAPPTAVAAEEPRFPLFTTLEINQATLQWKDQQLVLERFTTSPFFPGEELKLRSEARWRVPGFMNYELPHLLISTAVSRDRVLFTVNGKWKEGVIHLDGDWHRNLGGRAVYQAKIKLENVPLSPISGVLSRYHLWRSPLQYKSVWFSCEAQIAGDEKLQEGSIVTDTCAVSGELGKARIPHLQLGFSKNDFRRFQIQQAFEIELSAIDVEKVLKVFQIDMLGGVLRDFGRLQGVATIDVDGKSEFIGEIDDMFIGFSRNRARGQQWVPKLAGRFSIFDQRVSGQLDELVLKDGDFAGTMSFNFDRHFTAGHVQVGIEKMQFSPGIQHLLFGGETTPLSVFGKLTVERDKVNRWEGELGFDRLKRKDLSLEMIRVKSAFTDRKLVLTTQARKGWMTTDSALYRWLKPAFLGEKFEDQKLHLQELKTRVEIERNKGRWSRGQVHVEPAGIVLSSEGSWSENGLSGWLNVDFPEFKMVKWDIGGSSQEPRLLPNADNMRELARQRGKSGKKRKSKK